jgi:hypothetical protein
VQRILKPVRRLVAILLVSLFSFSLMAPVLMGQNADSQTPECCRRAGKHHCMEHQSDRQRSGANLTASCPQYPYQCVTPASDTTRYLKPARAFSATLHSHTVVKAETFPPYRVVCYPSSQKRGPPTSFL